MPLPATLTAVLPQWVARQRWYAGKGQLPVLRRVGGLRLKDPAAEAEIDVHLLLDESGRTPTLYQVPLTTRAHRLPGADRAATFLSRWPRPVGVAVRLRDGLRVAALPRTVAAAALLSVVAWSCTVFAVLAVGQSIGIQLTLGEGALLAAGTNLATAIPSGPGYLGTFEYAGKTIAVAFGLPAARGLALALLIHVLTLAVTTVGGVAALIRLGWRRKSRG